MSETAKTVSFTPDESHTIEATIEGPFLPQSGEVYVLRLATGIGPEDAVKWWASIPTNGANLVVLCGDQSFSKADELTRLRADRDELLAALWKSHEFLSGYDWSAFRQPQPGFFAVANELRNLLARLDAGDAT